MKKIMKYAATIALTLGTAALYAAENCIIVETSGREIKVSAITETNGDLTYTTGASAIKSKVMKGKYKYAWIPKPKEITDADAKLAKGDYKDAADGYQKAFATNKLLGWDVYCTWKEAEALSKQDKTADAVKKLETLKDYKLVNPTLEPDLLNAYKLLSTLYISQDKYDLATPYIDKLMKSPDESLASSAFIRKGDILARKNNKKEAALAYFQAALLFPKSSDRPEALFKSSQMLTDLKDSRSAKFADILKAEYPGNEYTKQLK